MRAFVREFKEFISRGNVLDLAVGVVIGIAFTTMVNSFVNDILNAFIGAVIGKPNFDDLTLAVGDGVIRYGAFLTAVVNFLIVAFALFLVVKAFNTFRRKEEPEPQHTEKDVLIEIRDLLRVAVDGDEPAPPTPTTPGAAGAAGATSTGTASTGATSTAAGHCTATARPSSRNLSPHRLRG